jgi:hypothetical protein
VDRYIFDYYARMYYKIVILLKSIGEGELHVHCYTVDIMYKD